MGGRGLRWWAEQARQERHRIPDAMRELRSDAEQQRGRLVRTTLAGWTFILSIDARLEMQDQSLLKDVLVRVLSGSELARREPEPCEEHEHWHFSARLAPLGRPSTVDDWHNLGLAVGAVGVPDHVLEAALAQVEEAPDETIHFPWTEPRSPRTEPPPLR